MTRPSQGTVQSTVNVVYSHPQELRRDSFVSSVMTSEGLLSLRGAEGDMAISAGINNTGKAFLNSRLLSRTAIYILGAGVGISPARYGSQASQPCAGTRLLWRRSSPRSPTSRRATQSLSPRHGLPSRPL